MVALSRAPLSTIFLLFVVLYSTSQFYIPSNNFNLSSIKQDDYQFVLTSNIKLVIVKSQRLEAQLKLSQPCQPISIQILKQGVRVEIANSTLVYTIKIKCQFRNLTFRYSEFSKTLQQLHNIQKNSVEKQTGIRRLLQNSTNNTNISLCGNNIVETFQDCDDGNKISGDGCSVSCTYQCGDGIFNSVLQQCDDGNRVSGDGCSSTCKTENPGAALGVGLGVSIGVAALVGVVVGQVAAASSAAAAAGASSIAGAQGVGNIVGNIQLGQTMKMMNPGNVI